ncbi:MAG: hypothetical protein AAFO69_08775 [Bacteroidota bacterium]
MKESILLWYNELLGAYFVGNSKDYQVVADRYGKGVVDILYTMDSDQHALCKKIRDRLNEARMFVKAS